jgi:hypothetical protein
MAPNQNWRSLLPDPFWPSLLLLLMVSSLTALPLWVLCALLVPDAGGWAVTLIFVGGYVVAVPVTWWLLRWRMWR